VNSRLSWLHIETHTFEFSLKEKIWCQIPHVKVPLQEMELIAAFSRRMTEGGLGSNAGSSRSNSPGDAGPGGDDNKSDGNSNRDIEDGGTAGSGGAISGGHVDGNGGDAPLNNACLGLDGPFVIDAWGGRTEWPAPSATSPILSSLDHSTRDSPISDSDSDMGSEFSGTNTDTEDDPNSEEFMALFAPARYQEFLQRKAVEQSVMARGRVGGISEWRMGVEPNVASGGP